MGKTIKRIAAVLTAGLLLTTGLGTAPLLQVKADDDEIPLHKKTSTPNEDGTYKLELSVTGDADDESFACGHPRSPLHRPGSTGPGNHRARRHDRERVFSSDLTTPQR